MVKARLRWSGAATSRAFLLCAGMTRDQEVKVRGARNVGRREQTRPEDARASESNPGEKARTPQGQEINAGVIAA